MCIQYTRVLHVGIIWNQGLLCSLFPYIFLFFLRSWEKRHEISCWFRWIFYFFYNFSLIICFWNRLRHHFTIISMCGVWINVVWRYIVLNTMCYIRCTMCVYVCIQCSYLSLNAVLLCLYIYLLCSSSLTRAHSIIHSNFGHSVFAGSFILRVCFFRFAFDIHISIGS